jgi:hypothetical protein
LLDVRASRKVRSSYSRKTSESVATFRRWRKQTTVKNHDRGSEGNRDPGYAQVDIPNHQMTVPKKPSSNAVRCAALAGSRSLVSASSANVAGRPPIWCRNPPDRCCVPAAPAPARMEVASDLTVREVREYPRQSTTAARAKISRVDRRLPMVLPFPVPRIEPRTVYALGQPTEP